MNVDRLLFLSLIVLSVGWIDEFVSLVGSPLGPMYYLLTVYLFSNVDLRPLVRRLFVGSPCRSAHAAVVEQAVGVPSIPVDGLFHVDFASSVALFRHDLGLYAALFGLIPVARHCAWLLVLSQVVVLSQARFFLAFVLLLVVFSVHLFVLLVPFFAEVYFLFPVLLPLYAVSFRY